MNRSMELAPPFNPMRIAATYQPPAAAGTAQLPLVISPMMTSGCWFV